MIAGEDVTPVPTVVKKNEQLRVDVSRRFSKRQCLRLISQLLGNKRVRFARGEDDLHIRIMGYRDSQEVPVLVVGVPKEHKELLPWIAFMALSRKMGFEPKLFADRVEFEAIPKETT